MKFFVSHIITGAKAPDKLPDAIADKAAAESVPDWQQNWGQKTGPKKWEPAKWVTGGAPQSKWGKNEVLSSAYPKFGVLMQPPRWPPPRRDAAKETIKP